VVQVDSKRDLPNGGDTGWMTGRESGYDMALTVSGPGSSQGSVQAVGFIFAADTDLDEAFLEGSYW